MDTFLSFEASSARNTWGLVKMRSKVPALKGTKKSQTIARNDGGGRKHDWRDV
jgi:hypothetical protein